MPRRKIDVKPDPLDSVLGNDVDPTTFSFGAVSEILGIEAWRLQKFLDSPRYSLKPTHVGSGHGSRNWFSTEDVYRIGIANFLAKDGFAPKLIAAVLRQIHDRDLIDFDEHGEVRRGITLTRTGKGPRLGYFRPGQSPDQNASGAYYILDLGAVTREIDGRISDVVGKKGGK